MPIKLNWPPIGGFNTKTTAMGYLVPKCYQRAVSKFPVVIITETFKQLLALQLETVYHREFTI